MILYSYWKQRLYAFLLRKILGSFLDYDANQKLHNLVEISIQEGIYVFHNVGLNSNYISSLINKQNSNDFHISIRSAIIHRLEIQLSIQENTNANTTNAASSLAWRAIQLGTNSNKYRLNDNTNEINSSGVSLVARIIIHGITIEIEPYNGQHYQQHESTTGPTKTTNQPHPENNRNVVVGEDDDEEQEDVEMKQQKSMISEYIDSALSSLRLSVDIKNLYIRMNSTTSSSSTSSNNNKPLSAESSNQHPEKESWIQLRIYSCSYHDVVSSDNNNNGTSTTTSSTNATTKSSSLGSSCRTKMHKTLSFHDRITILTGDRIKPQHDDNNDNKDTTILSRITTSWKKENKNNDIWIDENVSMIGMLETSNESSSTVNNPNNVSSLIPSHQISIRVIEYNDNNNNNNNHDEKIIGQRRHDDTISNTQLGSTNRIQQDISIELNQSINMSLDTKSIEQIQTVMNAFTSTSIPLHVHNDDSDSKNDELYCTDDDTGINSDNDNNDDTKQLQQDLEDWKILNDMMNKQYDNARSLVERGEITGGILVLSIEKNDHNGLPEITYDTFFDANDNSFSIYTNDLRNSILYNHHDIMIKNGNNDDHKNNNNNWCHTKLRIHFKEGGMKLSFQPCTPRPEEYILLTFSEVNISSSISIQSAEHQLSINYLDIEDSSIVPLVSSTTVDETNNNSRTVVEISSILRFNSVELQQQSHFDDDDDEYHPVDDVYDDDDEENGILIQSNPCITLTVKKRNNAQRHINDNNIVMNKEFGFPNLQQQYNHRSAAAEVTNTSVVDIDLTLEPLEISFSPSTITKIISFVDATKKTNIKSNNNEDSVDLMKNQAQQTKQVQLEVRSANDIDNISTNFNLFCHSITIDWIISQEKIINENDGDLWTRLYDRCGYSMKSNHTNVFTSTSKTSNSKISTLLENVSVEVSCDPFNDGNTYTFNCHNVIVYATSPQCMKCFDILALCGRNEVDPSIPVSLQLWQKHKTKDAKIEKLLQENKEEDEATDNPGSLTVPRVLPISSFKARQDDDEDIVKNDMNESSSSGCDWVLSSSSSLTNNGSTKISKFDQQGSSNLPKKMSSGLDPQLDMIKIASSCNYVITLHIPELISDLTVSELVILSQMINNVKIVDKEIDQYHDTQSYDDGKIEYKSSNVVEATKHDHNDYFMNIAISLRIDFVGMALHGEVPCSVGTTLAQNVSFSKVSYCTSINELKLHTVFIADEVETKKHASDTVVSKKKKTLTFRHARFLLQDIDLYEVSNLVRPIASPNPLSFHDRLNKLNYRGRCHAGSFATPLLHRSHMFSPMSKSNPVMLFDIVNVINTTADLGDIHVSQMNIYFTLYDLTYRFNYDSQWIKRLLSILPETISNTDEVSSSPKNNDAVSVGKVTSVLRVFLSVADCNIDYCSSTRFKTASRMILRVGDFRVSSNIAKPQTVVQAYRVSFGDVSVYLCNNRYLYNYENKNLLRSEHYMRQDEISLRSLGLPPDSDSNAVIRSMNYRTILVLDSLDASISVTSKKPKHPIDAYITVSFKIGEIRIVACKDSFALFMATITEMTTELSAIDDNAFDLLKSKSVQETEEVQEEDSFYDPETDDDDQYNIDKEEEKYPHFCKIDATTSIPEESPSFLLDGYDWTAIETVKSNSCNIPDGEEQAAKWYSNDSENYVAKRKILIGVGIDHPVKLETKSTTGPNFLPYHVPLQPVADPIYDGDMKEPMYAGLLYQPQVKMRILIHDLSLKLVFFDGYDWPELVNLSTAGNLHNSFVIPEIRPASAKDDVSPSKLQEATEKVGAAKTNVKGTCEKVHNLKMKTKEAIPIERRRVTLLNDLLDQKASSFDDIQSNDKDTSDLFRDIPLADERVLKLKEEAETRRLSRNAGKYIQLNVSGVTLRMDFLEESDEHRLVSCMNFKANDFFVAETISNAMPVKMVGEWIDEIDHPRDTRDGLLMVKLVNWHPKVRITPENEIANDEAEETIKLLPLRCMLDQRAIAFARALFNVDNDCSTSDTSLPKGLYPIPPPLFRSLRMRSFQVKVDYIPQQIDSNALRNGALVELVNLMPIHGMILTLQAVFVQNEIGFGSAMSFVVCRWVEDICSTQLAKFVTNARPFEPVTKVYGASVDMIVMPYDAFSAGQNVKKAMRRGAKMLSKTLMTETITFTSRTAEFLSGNISKVASLNDQIIPKRPYDSPKDFSEATPHAVAALSRGFQVTNHKIIIIPYREYQRSGITGAVTSVLKGIPIAVAAPASATAEAVSFGLLGVRNQLRPDIRKEEEFEKLKHHLFDK